MHSFMYKCTLTGISLDRFADDFPRKIGQDFPVTVYKSVKNTLITHKDMMAPDRIDIRNGKGDLQGYVLQACRGEMISWVSQFTCLPFEPDGKPLYCTRLFYEG